MYQVKNKILDKGSSHKSLKKQTRFFFTFRYIIIDLLVLYRHDITNHNSRHLKQEQEQKSQQ
jgi:hypothetical protein